MNGRHATDDLHAAGLLVRRLEGVVVHGYGVASGQSDESPYPEGTVRMQAPFFADRGLDLSGLHLATLNVSIAPLHFRMGVPEFRFPRIAWTELHPAEDFSFSRCVLEFDGVRHDALVYYPHPETKARHFVDDQTIEIIAPYIERIQAGDVVLLAVRSSEVEVTG